MNHEPHKGQPILTTGAPLDKATAVMIMLHGRGADAQSILTLAAELNRPDFAYLAPQAADSTWYPNRFLVPTRLNQPWLDSALAALDSVVNRVTAAGIPAERLFLLGFSQGACLTLEYAARNAKRYGGVIGLSGGLIGADDEPRQDHGSFVGAPIFLGCSDTDFHIPAARVGRAADVLKSLGANVTIRLYPDMDHTVNEDELAFVRDLIKNVPKT
ncbi:MAG TPA: dienelactone hydrolase family protein [Anaerolineales bacterium]|nr:dienelactone hydrolase family protein [Anaerolineales bacterium]